MTNTTLKALAIRGLDYFMVLLGAILLFSYSSEAFETTSIASQRRRGSFPSHPSHHHGRRIIHASSPSTTRLKMMTTPLSQDCLMGASPPLFDCMDSPTTSITTTTPEFLSMSHTSLFLTDDSILAATIPDVVQQLVIAFVVLAVLLAAVSTFLTQSYVPEQLNNMALLVQEANPQAWDDMTAQLQPGERVRDRPDLMAQLTALALQVMETETEEELQQCIDMIRQYGREQAHVTATTTESQLRRPLEATLGVTLEEFCAKVHTSQDNNSTFLTPTRVELAELIQNQVLQQ